MSRTQTSQLTPTHLRILQAIVRIGSAGMPATVSHLAQELEYAGQTSITPTLQIMRRNGFVAINGGGERGRTRIVTLTPMGRNAVGIGGLCVLGSIPAGPLKEILEQCETVLEPQDLIPHQPGDFLLIVEGDSMIGDGIMPGDKVLLRPGVQVNHGEIAAVHVGSECQATLKHVFFLPERHQIILRASNPLYMDIIVNEDDIQVVGTCRGLIRCM